MTTPPHPAPEVPGDPTPAPPPAPPHRPRRSARERGRRLGAGVVVLAALAVGHVVTSAFPVDDRVAAPFLRPGQVGEPVDLRWARLTVGEPRGSTVLARPGNPLLATPGVWVVVPLAYVSHDEPRLLGFAELHGGDGRVYPILTSGRAQLLTGYGQAGVTRYATAHVEVPPEAVPGAHLHVGVWSWDQRHDDVADVDLGLTQADADAWSASTTPVATSQGSDMPPEER